ncbi:MAG: hypothetical protein KF760_21290 [Candidatus Eremiobacteraeota bacterium]|nr:hypothetical protein [Candidatus Eremiobacteraeota bacterium]MCW5867538.1 hypothetical protein [Candidatus Eremiobacteraeota bacterium]
MFRILLILWLATQMVWAQNLRPEQMMVLLIGSSTNHPTPDQQAALARLKALRQQQTFRQLKIGTMHFDRPAEARFATQVLGVDRSQLPCLCLVQLDSQLQRPVRKLYSIPRVTRQQLEQVEAMGRMWAQSAGGLSLPPTARNRLLPGQTLQVGGSVTSLNGQYVFALQGDGNLVLSRYGNPLWSSQTNGQGGVLLSMGPDGILRLTAPNGQMVWQTRSSGSPGNYFFEMQDDGNAVIYLQEPGRTVFVWSTETPGR